MSDECHTEPEFYEAEFEIKCKKKYTELKLPYGANGFSNGNTDEKTGYAIAYFDLKIAQKLCHFLPLPGNLQFNKKTDTFVYKYEGQKHVWKGEDITVVTDHLDGSNYDVHVYPIGEGLWPWKEIVKSWEYVSRAICPYCGSEFGQVNNTCEECGRTVNF